MTRKEAIALAQQVGPDDEATDSLEFIQESKGIIFIADMGYRWDEVCQDFELIS